MIGHWGPPKTEKLSAEANELRLYFANTHSLYKSNYLPTAINLQKKWKKGTFDRTLAAKGMRHAVDAAARSYAREHGSPGTPWHAMFSTADRNATARSIVDELVDEWTLGNFHDED